MRELSKLEQEEVSGGIVPLLIVGAAVLLTGCQTKGDTKPSNPEDGTPRPN